MEEGRTRDAGDVVAGTVVIRQAGARSVKAREVHPQNVRVLFGVREAVAFGAAAGLAVALVLGWRRR